MDTFNKRATISAIKEESKRGRTIVLTTHMLEEAEELCNTVAIMNHGKIIANGTIDEIKKMRLEMFYLSLKVKRVTNGIKEKILGLKPHNALFNNKEIELTLRNYEAALKILSMLYSKKLLLNFELSSASLEDVFIALLDKQAERTK